MNLIAYFAATSSVTIALLAAGTTQLLSSNVTKKWIPTILSGLKKYKA